MRDEELIGLYAGRLAGFAAQLSEAHRLGISPGDDDEPWSVEFHLAAMASYDAALPERYLATLGQRFGAMADIMNSKRVPGELQPSWTVVRSYLANYAEAAFDELVAASPPTRLDLEATNEETPALLRFDLVAARVSTAGAHRLRQAAEAVAGWSAASQLPELSDEQLGWLQELADGTRVLDIAIRNGLSRRSMYREFRRMWDTLGVEGREQGLAKAAELGLVSVID